MKIFVNEVSERDMSLKVNYSRHARKQMKWRDITEDEVQKTVVKPEKVEDSVKGRKNAFKLIGNKLIKVTFKEENGTIIIITAIDKNN